MSTIAPATARRLAAAHAERGAAYVAAPVFGRPDAAASGQLWIVTSGEAAAKAEVRPVLETLGQGVHDFGDDPAAAHIVKLAGNFLIAAASEAMAEAYTLGEKGGLDRVQLAEFFGSTLFPSRIYQNYGKAIAEHRYEPAGFKLELGLKDLRLVLGTADACEMPMPLASLLHDRLLALAAQGHGEIDWTGIGLGVASDAGCIRPQWLAGAPPRSGECFACAPLSQKISSYCQRFRTSCKRLPLGNGVQHRSWRCSLPCIHPGERSEIDRVITEEYPSRPQPALGIAGNLHLNGPVIPL